MIRQKTKIIATRAADDAMGHVRYYSLEQLQDIVNKTADDMLGIINTEEHAFISLEISHMPEIATRHLDRVFVTVVFRETPSRRVLTEKSKGE